MPSLTLNGPVVPTDAHNVVLRDALLHSPIERTTSTTSYHVIEIGVREGEFTTWVGTWDQSAQRVDGATPTSILDHGDSAAGVTERRGMRLKAGQAIVVKITVQGVPASLEGSRINFTLALVGGRDGPATALVAGAAQPTDPNARTALSNIQRQINEGGLSEWDEPVQLQDPVALVVTGTFQGRLQRDSTTQISLQRYGGNWVEVDGEALSISSTGIVCLSTDGLLSSSGDISATAPSTSTLYYVYVGSVVGGLPQLRLSATAPTSRNGTYYLGADPLTGRWRFAGWVRTNGSTQFTDDSTDRLVVNYYNRVRKNILLRPGYADDNAGTTYTTTSTTWTAANGGTGATGSYIANGEDGLHMTAMALVANSGAGSTRIGIGDNSGTTCAAETGIAGTAGGAVLAVHSVTPAAGYRTIVLLVSVSSGTGTYGVDDARNGSATDPVATGLSTLVAV